MSVRLHHQSADAIHFDLLWQYVGAYPEREVARCHGLSHWKRVEKYGLRIARYSGADATVVRLFALFHDAARVNNDIDEEHGPRAAELAKELCNILYTLDDSRFDLLYLNHLDHFIKRTLKVKKYCRYVDDFILFGLSREECLAHKVIIEKFLKEELNLELSKWTIQKVRRGVNFVGYRTWRTARFIRKYSLHKFRRAVRSGKLESIISLLGHAKRTCSLRWMMGIIDQTMRLPRKPWLLRYST